MMMDKKPRNIARFARENLTIEPGTNREAIKPPRHVGDERTLDRTLCWTSYYALVFAALATFLPYETAAAVERTVDLADSIGGILGLTDGWGVHIRGTLD